MNGTLTAQIELQQQFGSMINEFRNAIDELTETLGAIMELIGAIESALIDNLPEFIDLFFDVKNDMWLNRNAFVKLARRVSTSLQDLRYLAERDHGLDRNVIVREVEILQDVNKESLKVINETSRGMKDIINDLQAAQVALQKFMKEIEGFTEPNGLQYFLMRRRIASGIYGNNPRFGIAKNDQSRTEGGITNLGLILVDVFACLSSDNSGIFLGKLSKIGDRLR